ncbi:MAG: ASCH domain-containing protein [Candidatus Pacearchaeota archaeon]|jgi:predicted transcriptional regulator
MKALSLKQPFAELIVQGKKKIELRKWNTKFRGEFLIHASKTPDKKSMKNFGFESLPQGAIVGKAKLIDVKKYTNKTQHAKDKKFHLASSYWGNYGFIIENPQRLNPIPYKGQLNFFEVNLK